MWFINTFVAYIITTLITLGVLAIVVAGASSYVCPFQTLASITLRGLWKKVRPWDLGVKGLQYLDQRSR